MHSTLFSPMWAPIHNHFPTSLWYHNLLLYQCTALISFSWLTQSSCLFFQGILLAQSTSEEHSIEFKSWTFISKSGLIDVQLTTTFHHCLLYTFNTRRFPLCPLLSSAACDLTVEQAPVSNKHHCLTWIGMLVWTTGICYRGSLFLCLVHHLGPLGIFCSVEY